MLLYFLHENRFSIVLNLNMTFLNYQRRKKRYNIYILNFKKDLIQIQRSFEKLILIYISVLSKLLSKLR